jgi:hypothetical protein
MFLVASPAYLLIAPTRKKFQRVLIFIFPMILIGVCALIAGQASGKQTVTTVRLQRVVSEATTFISSYDHLDASLKQSGTGGDRLHSMFNKRMREILFAVPAISIAHNFVEGVFYPFALVYFIGFAGLRRRLREDRRIGYFLLLSLSGFLLLYIHMIHTWIMAHRFLALLIFPGCVIMANGVQRVVDKLSRSRQWPLGKAAAVTAAALVLLGLPKSLKPEERDKTAYRQAARVISEDRAPGLPAPLFAVKAQRGFEWVLLYAHRKDPVLRCSESLLLRIPDDYASFLESMDRMGARYFFYEERKWPMKKFDLAAAARDSDLTVIGRWTHPDSGELVLYERTGGSRRSLPPKGPETIPEAGRE